MDVVIFTYRYMWTLKGDTSRVNFKIISDTLEGHNSFISSLFNSFADKLDKVSREYLHEYNVSKLGIFEPVDVPLDVSE